MGRRGRAAGPVGGRAEGPGEWAGGRRGPVVGRFCRWLRNSLGHSVSLSFFRARFSYGRFFVQLFFRTAVFSYTGLGRGAPDVACDFVCDFLW